MAHFPRPQTDFVYKMEKRELCVVHIYVIIVCRRCRVLICIGKTFIGYFFIQQWKLTLLIRFLSQVFLFFTVYLNLSFLECSLTYFD